MAQKKEEVLFKVLQTFLTVLVSQSNIWLNGSR